MRSRISKVLGLLLFVTVQAAFACNLKIGQSVYGNNGNHLVGEVFSLFGEKVEVRWQLMNGLPAQFSNASFWDCSNLKPEVVCYSHLCQKNYVYGNNGNHLMGFSDRIFEGGVTEILWQYINGQYNSNIQKNYWTVERLSKQTLCHGGICQKSIVYGNNGNHLSGSVEVLFENGVTSILWQRINGAPVQAQTYSFWPTDKLSRRVEILDQFQRGDTVYGNNGNHLVGGVLDIFENGIVEVLWQYINGQPISTQNASYWPHHKLTKQNL